RRQWYSHMKHALAIQNRDLQTAEQGRRDVICVPLQLSRYGQHRLLVEFAPGQFIRRKRSAHSRDRARPQSPRDRYLALIRRTQPGRWLMAAFEEDAAG